jgi:hypothetical protein
VKKYIAKSISNCRGFVDYDDIGEFECMNMTEALVQTFDDEEELNEMLNWADHGDRSISDLNVNGKRAVLLDGEETVVIVGEKGKKFDELYNLAKRVLNGDDSCINEYFENCLVS